MLVCSYELILFKKKKKNWVKIHLYLEKKKKKIDSYKFLHKWKLKINQHFKLKKKTFHSTCHASSFFSQKKKRKKKKKTLKQILGINLVACILGSTILE
jgi:hypothetical protein